MLIQSKLVSVWTSYATVIGLSIIITFILIMAVQITITIVLVSGLPNKRFLKVKAVEVGLTDYTEYTFTSFLIIASREGTDTTKNDPNFPCPPS